MAGQADIREPEVLGRVRAAVIRFTEGSLRAADAVLSELSTTYGWLRQERVPALRAQIRRLEEDVSSAAAAHRWARDMKPSCVEEELALRKARARLADAQAALETCRRTVMEIEREGPQLRARVERFRGEVERGGPAAVAALDRMRSSIEEYLRLPPPEAAP